MDGNRKMRSKQVKQRCNCCGHEFSLMYWENGTYTYLDDPCECETDFSPLGISLSEWLEKLKGGKYED